MKKLRWILLVAGVAVVAALVANRYRQVPTSAELKVGALLPQTGAGAVFAEYIRKGLEMAASEVNTRSPGSIRIIYADSRNDPTEGVTAFRQMVLTEKPPVIITALSSVTKAVAPLAKPNNTVVVGTAVSLPGVTAASDFVFRVYPEAEGVAGIIADYARARFKTAAVAYINDDFGVSGASVFEREFGKGGGKVLVKEPYSPTENDFRPQWEKIKAAAPECVWIIGYGPAYSVLVRQIREVQVPSVLLADMTLGLPTTLKNVGDAAEGVVYVDGAMEPAFAQRFQAKWNEPATSYAGYAYDTVMMLDQARREVGSSPEQIREGFARIRDYSGVMGPVSFSHNRDALLRFVLMKISGGRRERLEEMGHVR